MNNFLKWYSTIWISFSTLAVFVEWVTLGDSTSLWATILLVPVVIFLWGIVSEKPKPIDK